jgi:hypothetical protein
MALDAADVCAAYDLARDRLRRVSSATSVPTCEHVLEILHQQLPRVTRREVLAACAAQSPPLALADAGKAAA